jgi:hypothetical protein
MQASERVARDEAGSRQYEQETDGSIDLEVSDLGGGRPPMTLRHPRGRFTSK